MNETLTSPISGDNRDTRAQIPIAWALLLILVLTLLIALYWSARYGPNLTEGDSVRLTLAAERVAIEDRLMPTGAYNSGYGLPVLLTFVSEITGLSVETIQAGSSLWLAAFILIAFITYRELLGRTDSALITLILLLLQPDFIFYPVRSSHEKFTWAMALLLVFLLARSLRFTRNLGKLAIHVLLFYVVLWAMLTTNIFFTSTILTALTISLTSGLVLTMWFHRRAAASDPQSDRYFWQRLALISAAGAVLIFIFINNIYGPALSYYHGLDDLVERLSVLLLGAEETGAIQVDPYTYVRRAWQHQGLYFALTSFQWTIAGLIVVAWGVAARQLRSASRSAWLRWLLLSGYAAQMAFGILVDRLGFLSSNLQVRLFVPFVLFGTPLVVAWLRQVFERLQGKARTLARVALPIVALWAITTSLLKVTNDPLAANYWLFYHPQEAQALEWTESHLRYRQIWTDLSFRKEALLDSALGAQWYTTNRYRLRLMENPPPHILITDLTRLQANRWELALPSTVGKHR
ncbi:MAG: hypothetical protein JXB35_12900, partial [Anaerolineae bacterium]|nr:hypothetical protein [Anaerolineae bacterium]